MTDSTHSTRRVKAYRAAVSSRPVMSFLVSRRERRGAGRVLRDLRPYLSLEAATFWASHEKKSLLGRGALCWA